MALGILDPMSGSNFEALETGANVFRELKPSRMQVKAAIEHIAIGAAHMSESYVAEGLFRFLSIVGLSFHDMLFVAESLRRTSFLMRWILRYLIVKGAAHTSDDWLAEFFGEFCADLVEQDVSGNDEDEQAEERMFLTTPLLGHSTSGTRVQTGEPEPAVDYVHILQDIFAKRAPVSEDQFAEFYTEICDRVPWYEVVPGFLDPDRVPDECVIDVVWFVSNDTEHAFAAEEEAMRRFICSVLAYPGRISRERLHRVLQTKPGRAFGAPIVFREFPETDLSQISEQRVGDVISAMDMESFRSGGSKRVTVQPHRRPEVNMSADKTEPEPLDVLALVANRVPDAALLRTLSLVSHATAIASAGNAEWTRLFRARHPWVAELEGLASPLIESYEGEWTRGEVAQVAMRERVFKGDLAGIAPEVVEELQAEIASVEDLFASVLEEVQAMEGKDEGADGAASAAGPAVDTAMEEVEALEDLDISDSSDASDASSASTDSIAPVTPAEQLLHILGVIPSYLPAIHLLAFLLLLNGRFAESAKAAQIGIQLSGAEDKLGFRELELEATTRAASEDSAMDMEPEPHASSLSDPSNAPLFLSNKLLDALYSTFLRFSSSGTQLSAAEFGTVIQKTNGRSIPLKDIKGMVEGLEKGVEEVEGLREWVAEWLSRQPQPPAPLGPARSGVKGLSLAGWFLFFSRQLHTEDGEQETRADLEKLGWTEAL